MALEISPIRLVFVVVFDHLVEVMVRLHVIVRDALTVRIHLAEFPSREILPAVRGIGQRRGRRIGVASFQVVEAGAQSLIGIGEVLRDLLRGSDVEPSKAGPGANPSVMDPMIAKAKRRRNGAFSTGTSAHATTRISIPSCHPAASRSFDGARDTDDFRHQ